MARESTHPIRIFVSSPGDVAQERVLAQKIINRLREEFAQRAAIEAVFWEHEPCRANDNFQSQLPRASESDICLLLIWSRLGTPVVVDGIPYKSGTEFEFHDALNAYKTNGSPELLVYRKTEQFMISTRSTPEEIQKIIDQQKAVDDFFKSFRDSEDKYLHAFHQFEKLSQLEEWMEEHLRKLIQGLLLRAGYEPKARPRWDKGSPFRGLAPFDETHEHIFFGRTAAIHDILKALRAQAADARAFVLVTGTSGAGKSSLVRAGVLPFLTRPKVIEGVALWRHAVFRPSQAGPQAGDPIDGLVAAIMRDEALPGLRLSGTSGFELAELFRANADAIPTLVRRELRQFAAELQREKDLEELPEARLVLVVDQLEEIFVQESISPAQRKQFAVALSVLARSGLVWVLATLRSDFYGRCAELPDIIALKEGAGHYDLRPPTLAEISLMIRNPANMAGLEFDVRPATQEYLADVLCAAAAAAAAEDGTALPLLEFTLEALYERCTADGLLTFAAYDELGGLEGALARRAEQVFSSLSPTVQQELPRILAALVSVGTGEDETLAQRRVPLDRLTGKPERGALIKAFVDQRLFVTDRTDDGTPVLGVAHEALLRRWPRIEDWVRQNRELLRARAHIAAAAALWAREGKSRTFLLSPGRSLEDGRALAATYAEALTPEELEFIAASVVAERDNRRRRLFVRAGAAAAVAMMLAAGGVYWFFYMRPDVEYYANRTREWGIYKGLSPVSKDEVKYRNSTYKFYKHGRNGSVYNVDLVNGYGMCARIQFDFVENAGGLNNEKQSPCRLDPVDPSPNKEPALCVRDRSQSVYSAFPDILKQPCRWELKTEDGKLQEERALDRTGRELYKLVFSGPDTAEYKSSQGYALPLVGSGASHLKFGWLEEQPYDGRAKVVRFMNANGSPKPDRSGKFGVRFDYEPNGLPSRMTYLNRNDTPVRTTDGTAIVTLAYDGGGQATDIVLFDHSGRPTRDDSGVARYKLTYDDHGNLSEIGFFDPHGRPTQAGKIGRTVVSMKFTYDQHDGNLTELAYFDEEKRRTPSDFGYSAISFQYDRRGLLTEQIYLDQAGRPIRSKQDGISGVSFEYGDSEQVRTIVYLDEEKSAARHREGYAKIALEYDTAGRLVSEAYLDEQGEPTLHSQGYAKLRYQYDENGQKTLEAYFDEKGGPKRRADGYAAISWTYDERNNYKLEQYLDERNKPTKQRQGYAGISWSYDDEGRVTEVLYVDEENRPISSKDGAAYTSLIYDDRGDLAEIAYKDEKYKPGPYRDGYAKAKYAYDDRGNQVEESYYNEHDRPVLYNNYARVWTTYDEYGRPTAVSFYSFTFSGSKDEPTPNPYPKPDTRGCYSYEYKYSQEDDVRRQCTGSEIEHQKSCLDGQGNPRWTWLGCYNEGNILEKEKYVIPDNGELPGDYSFLGASEKRYTYDLGGNKISETYYDKQRPFLVYDGYERVQWSYDKRGNWREKKYQTAAGRAAPLRGGRVVSERRVFDNRNRLVEHAYLDEAGKRVRNAAGFAIQRWAYNDYDQFKKVEFLSEMERPIRVSGGFASIDYRYDGRGNVDDMSFFDERGRRIGLRRERLPRNVEYKRNTEILDLFNYAAKHGSADALNMVGWMYDTGHCVKRDLAQAFQHYTRAAAQRDGFGLANLGMMYLKLMLMQSIQDAEFRTQLAEEAERQFRRSVRTGNAYGQTNLGMMYDKGWGVGKNDPVEAVIWFRRAADQTNGPGQSYLGYMYELGRGVPQDYREAARYYRLAAENGVAEGMTNLGLLYLKGLGVGQKNETEGATWLRKAAELGHRSAQYNLARLYENGQGIRKDTIEAIRWYAIALANNDADLAADQQDEETPNKNMGDGKNKSIRDAKKELPVTERARARLEALIQKRGLADEAARLMLAELDAEIGSRQQVDGKPYSSKNNEELYDGIDRFSRSMKERNKEPNIQFFKTLATKLYEYGHGTTILSDRESLTRD